MRIVEQKKSEGIWLLIRKIMKKKRTEEVIEKEFQDSNA